MGGTTRSQRHARSGVWINVYPFNITLGLKVVDLVKPMKAAEQLASGKYCEVLTPQGELLGIKPTQKPKRDHSSNPTPGVISAREMQRIAGCEGESTTICLSEEEHFSVPEDMVERAIRKMQQQPYPASRIDDGGGAPVYGDKAVRVYPKPG